MSEPTNFRVPVTTILEILPHPKPEVHSLEVARVYGFTVVVRKNQYKVGDRVIYVPIDSILTKNIEDFMFPEGSKIKLHKSRVKQIKIQGFYSQGLLINPNELPIALSGLFEERDLAEKLGITKYEAPAPSFQTPGGPKLRDKPFTNPYFRTYGGLTNIKWNPHAFNNDEEVVMQVKYHGSHIRMSKAPFTANTVWKKIVKFFGFAPKFEFCIGSNNVELTNRKNYSGFYGSDVYSKAAERLNVMDKIKDGEFWHGELVGEGIQSNYHYGYKEHHIIFFDVRILQPDGTQKWLDPEEAETLAKERGLDFALTVYKGLFSKETLDFHTKDVEAAYPKHVREGVVCKARYNYDNQQSKRAYKSINPVYLSKEQSEFH